VAKAESDEFAPILPGPGQSDYERYLRTDELLALQKGPDEWAHRDELLFQTVHQSSELWLKHAWVEAEEATRLVEARDLAAANRLLRRSTACLEYVEGFLEHLELMSPWEYQEVRRVLGHGSGFDSPGFREIRRVSVPLYAAFDDVRKEAGLSLLDVYVDGRDHEELYQLAELLTEWDERVGLWRYRHFKVVARIIGEDVVGTQGTPVELLAGLIKNKMFPELWRVRTDLTELAKQSD
jgi:tryptophan 2,3-dioxygenase